jgi:hypothetical protein
MCTVPRQLAVALLIVGVALCSSGCTFYLLPGEGPAPRSAYADRLVGISPAEAAQLKSEALLSHGFTGVGPFAIEGRDDLAGAVLHQSSIFAWAMLVGPAGRWWYLEPGAADGSGVRALVGHAWGWGVLAPTLLGWGPFALGTKDRRAYIQLAWIPIPLWRVSP